MEPRLHAYEHCSSPAQWQVWHEAGYVPHSVRGSRSTGSVVELWDVERRHPLLAAPRKDLDFRREPLVEAIESAFLHVNDARTVLQVVGDHPGTAVCTEDAIEPLAPTCFGVRTVGETLGASAQDGEVLLRHHRPCCHLRARRSFAIRAVAVSDEGRLRIEPVRHPTAGTVTGVLLAHIFFRLRQIVFSLILLSDFRFG